MHIEHAAWTVADPPAATAWYSAHLGMSVVRRADGPARTHFLADSTGRVLLEIYHNPKVAVPDYRAMDPLVLHLAFAVEDVGGARARLLAAGASPVGEVAVTPEGDQMAMLRDPWGFPIQVVKRARPMG